MLSGKSSIGRDLSASHEHYLRAANCPARDARPWSSAPPGRPRGVGAGPSGRTLTDRRNRLVGIRLRDTLK